MANDFDDDDLLADFDEIDSATKEKPNSKGPGGMVYSSGVDLATGIWEGAVGSDILDTIMKAVKATIPSAIKSEFSVFEEGMNNLKETVLKNVDESMGLVKEAAKGIADVFPDDNKIGQLLKDFSKKEASGDAETPEQSEQDKINSAVLEAMGNANKAEQTATIIKETMEAKRHESTQSVLKEMNARLAVVNDFNANTTYKFYSKSLEIQYKLMYKVTEMTELTKVGWEANRRQLEGILGNTAMPDLIKTMELQAKNDPRLKPKARENFIGRYFKDFNPFQALMKNLTQNISNRFQAVNDGLRAALDLTGAGKDIMDVVQQSEESGVSKFALAGNEIGEWLRDKTLGKFGERLAKTKLGRKAIFNFKDFAADAKGYLADKAAMGPDNTKFGKLKSKVFRFLSPLTGSPEKERVDFSQEDLNAPKAFDGRVHTAIVKIIPGYLGKMLAVMETGFRVKRDDYEDKILHYDTKTGRFMSSGDFSSNLKAELKKAVNNDGYRDALERFFSLYNGANIAFNTTEKGKIAQAITAFMLDAGTGSVNPGTLLAERFLDHVTDPKLRQKLQEGGSILLENARNGQYDILDTITSTLSGVRKNLPNMHGRLKELHAQGQMDFARDLGFVKQDGSGRWALDEDGEQQTILDTVKDLQFRNDEGARSDGKLGKFLEMQESVRNSMAAFKDKLAGNKYGKAVLGFGEKLAGTRTAKTLKFLASPITGMASKAMTAANNKIIDNQNRLIDFLNQDEEAVIDHFINKKTELEDIMKPENLKAMPKKALAKAKSEFRKANDQIKKTSKDFAKKAADVSLGDVKEIYAKGKRELDKVTRDFMEDAKEFGATPERIARYNAKIKEIKDKTEAKVKNSKSGKFIGGKIGQAANSKVGRKARWFGGLFASKASGVLDKAKTKASDFMENHEDTTLGDVYQGSKRFLKNQAKAELDAMRSGSWRNRAKKWLPFFKKDDDGNKRSGFLSKKFAKTLIYGGIAMAGVHLLQKLGITMEDVAEGVKKGFHFLKGFGQTMVSIFDVMKPIFIGIGKTIGWLGSKFNFLGSKETPKLDQNGQPMLDDSGNLIMEKKADYTTYEYMGMGAGAVLTGYTGYKAISKTARAIKAMTGFFRGARGVKGAVDAASTAADVAKAAKSSSLLAKAGKNLTSGFVGALKMVGRGALGALKLGGKLAMGALKMIPGVGSVIKAIETVIKVGKLKFGPKFLIKFLGRILLKVGTRVAGIAAGMTGVGIVATIASVIMTGKDIYDIYSYMRAGKDLASALACWAFGEDVFAEDYTQPLPEDPAAEAAYKQTESDLKQNDQAQAEATKTGSAQDSIEAASKPNENVNRRAMSILNPSSSSNFGSGSSSGYTVSYSTTVSRPGNSYVPPRGFVYNGIGSVSAWFESRANPGIISSGKGDAGGKSYGTYQLASKTGTLQEFLKKSRYKAEFKGLTPNTPEFEAKWAEIANRDPVGFQKDQDAFIRSSHYEPCVRRLRQIGLDVNARSEALQAAVFSAAVHYGPKGAYNKIKGALEHFGLDPLTANDKDIIQAIYNYKILTVNTSFRSSSEDVRAGIVKRAYAELDLVNNLLRNQGGGAAPSINNSTTSRPPDAPSTITTVDTAPAPSNPLAVRTSTGGGNSMSASGQALRDAVNTSTTALATGAEKLLAAQLKLQSEMLVKLGEISTNTKVFAQLGAPGLTQQQTPQITEVPQPAINLNRRDTFNI